MSDVFISYARGDRALAHRLAEVLQGQGLSVWWDRDLLAGQKFAQVIARELDTARCVLVLWSAESVASNWVSDEASEGQRRGVLVPVTVEAGVLPPLGFRGLHTPDLSAWAAGQDPVSLRAVLQAVQGTVHPGRGGEVPPPPPEPPPGPPPPPPPAVTSFWKKPWFWGVWMVGGLLSVAAERGGWMDRGDGDSAQTLAPLSQAVQWRDDVLSFSGQVQWDGHSPMASMQVAISDMPSGRPLGQQQVMAKVMRFGPQEIELSAQLPVSGDSQTPMPHAHNVNLLFRAEGGGWRFERNCMRQPGQPEQCW